MREATYIERMSKIQMTNAELRAARQRMGLTQADLSRVLGVHWTTLSDWERGAASVPHQAALLVELMAGNGEILALARQILRCAPAQEELVT